MPYDENLHYDSGYIVQVSLISNGGNPGVLALHHAPLFARAAYNAVNYLYGEGNLPFIADLGSFAGPSPTDSTFWDEYIPLIAGHPIFEASSHVIYERALEVRQFLEDGRMDWLDILGVEVIFNFDRIEQAYKYAITEDMWQVWSNVMFSSAHRDFEIVPIANREIAIHDKEDLQLLISAQLQLSKMIFGFGVSISPEIWVYLNKSDWFSEEMLRETVAIVLMDFY